MIGENLKLIRRFSNKTEFIHATVAGKLLQAALLLCTMWSITRTYISNTSNLARDPKSQRLAHTATRFLTKTFLKITSERATGIIASSVGIAKKVSRTLNRWECELLSFKIEADNNKKNFRHILKKHYEGELHECHCGAVYKNKYDLNHHKKAHDPPITCDVSVTKWCEIFKLFLNTFLDLQQNLRRQRFAVSPLEIHTLLFSWIFS